MNKACCFESLDGGEVHFAFQFLGHRGEFFFLQAAPKGRALFEGEAVGRNVFGLLGDCFFKVCQPLVQSFARSRKNKIERHP